MQINIILLESSLKILVTCLKGVYVFWYHTVLRNYSKEKVPNLGTFFISNNCTGCADASGPNVHTWRTSVLDLNHPVF